MSSSTDAGTAWVQPVFVPAAVAPVEIPELRRGQWTRLGPSSLLGDAAAEQTLADVADQAHAAASAQGYSVGWAQGLRKAEAQARAQAEAAAEQHAIDEARRQGEHAAAVAALVHAADQLQAELGRITARVEIQATQLAWALTEELVGREVQVVTGADVVRRVLALSPDGPVARVQLHPDHLAHPAVADLVSRGVAVVGDPALGRADAVVEVDDHALDLRIEPAMGRLREVLS